MVPSIRPLSSGVEGEKKEGEKLEPMEVERESPEAKWKCMRKCLEILHHPKNPLAYLPKCEYLCKKVQD